MATISKKISKRIVDEAEPEDRDLFIRDPELKGFGLKVTPNGGKTYFLEYRMGGRGAPKGRITIGRHGSPWAPDRARERAKELLELVKRGINPVAHKAEQNRLAVDLAFRSYADLFVERYAKRHQVRSWQQAQRVLDHDIKPVLKDRPIHEINRGEIKRLLEVLAQRAPALARYAHATLRKLFRWAVDRGDIERSPMAEMTPPAPTSSRDRVLADDEVRAVWNATVSLNVPFGAFFRLLILTGQRRSEVAGMSWAELDRATATWTIPAERAKNGLSHIVPLSAAVLKELGRIAAADNEEDGQDGRQWPESGFVLTTTGRTPISGITKAKKAVDAAISNGLEDRPLSAWRIHDLRRTLATGLQRLGVRLEVTEAILNHTSGSRAGIVGVYQRYTWGDEKRLALEQWAAKVSHLCDPNSHVTTNVVPLKRGVE